jgi:predicted dithiol-disulfide oxidoreductase (DUF899 family)
MKQPSERVAEQRRQLPAGAEVTRKYSFESQHGPVGLAEMFGNKDTLVVYSFMYGPARKRPCPMCTTLMAAWQGEARQIEQRVAFAMVARSTIERLDAFWSGRGWKNLRLYSDTSGEYTRDYVSAEDADMPGFVVFTRRDGAVRHFWSSEMGAQTADPGQDPRGAPDLMPLWIILDNTPEGRGTDWYPTLDDAA